ncbi:MAG: hypothetical protein JSU73_14130 [candidate division WOR-3 bacterium]|nr:MAG: hypothetical protein JSU73_14130 [candidate division WOR-3 bacterium]
MDFRVLSALVAALAVVSYSAAQTAAEDARPDPDGLLLSDVGATEILAPIGYVDSGTTVGPRAVIENFGDEDAVFPVLMQIGAGYAYLVTESLPGGAIDTVLFPDWIAAPVGTLAVTCFTDLEGDENRTNDTARAAVQVIRPAERDVAVVRILSPPGSVDSGDYLVPSALVANYGQGVSFPVTLTIGTGYTSTVSMTLEVGETDTVRFTGWSARPSGLLEVTCYSELAGDQNRANDTVVDTVYVIPGALHDFAPVAIVAPGLTHAAGDTVVPKAWVRNMGTRTERYAQIRFRIGSNYDHTVNLPSAVRPGDSIEIAVESYPWVAVPGAFTVSCSTLLAGDVRPSNDILTHTTQVSVSTSLDIRPGYSVESVDIGTTRSLPFSARIYGDTGDVVALRALNVGPQWTVRFFDPDQNQPLPDTDGDGLPDLSYLRPGIAESFDVVVEAPSGLHGDLKSIESCTATVRGSAVGHEEVADDAVLVLVLTPVLDIHNYPNPYNPYGSRHHFFRIGVQDTGIVSLTVYDRAGTLVRRVLRDSLFHPSVTDKQWPGENEAGQVLAPGTYQYLLEFTGRGETRTILKKLVITRE